MALAPLLLTLLSGTARADPTRTDPGAMLYAQHCQTCHGEQGDGRGPAGRVLRPPPRDFTRPAFWSEFDPDRLAEVIRVGKPGTAMPAFATLTAADVTAVVHYLTFFRDSPNPALETP